MLPEEADTAVQLHAFLRGVHRDLPAVRRGQRHHGGASGHLVGQAPDSQAGRHVRAAGAPSAQASTILARNASAWLVLARRAHRAS
jgi:hypothetical protein